MRFKWRSKVIETDRQVKVVLGLSRHTFVCLPKMINEEPALWHYLEGKMSSLKGMRLILMNEAILKKILRRVIIDSWSNKKVCSL